MPPAEVVGVLGVGVLAVVDQQRGVAGEAEAGDPLLLERVEVGAEGGLVVGDVGERVVAVVDPVAERRAAVGDRGGADPRRADLPLGLRRVAEGDVAGQLAHLDRRERRRDVAGDAVAQRGLRRGRPPDHDLGLRPEAGGEEDQALDVVEVEVGEQDVQAGRLVGQGEAEVADAGAGVERQQRAVGEGDADAGGVAAVADRLRARGGDRAARAPELGLHLRPRLRWRRRARRRRSRRASRARSGSGRPRPRPGGGRRRWSGSRSWRGRDGRRGRRRPAAARRRGSARRSSSKGPKSAPHSSGSDRAQLLPRLAEQQSRPPRCRRRAARPRRPGRQGSRGPTSGCEQESAQVASGTQLARNRLASNAGV